MFIFYTPCVLYMFILLKTSRKKKEENFLLLFVVEIFLVEKIILVNKIIFFASLSICIIKLSFIRMDQLKFQ